jgi:dihydrofolate reductase
MVEHVTATDESRTMIAALQISLDGYIEGPDGEKDWVGSWADAIQLIPDVDTFVLGAGMYPGYGEYWGAIHADPERVLAFQGRAPSDSEIAYARLAAATPHVVLSRTLETVSWPRARIVRDVAELRALKGQSGGNMYVAGGASLVTSLLTADLIDELRLIVHPVILGGGKPLFGGVERRSLELVETRSTEAGRLILTYRT